MRTRIVAAAAIAAITIVAVPACAQDVTSPARPSAGAAPDLDRDIVTLGVGVGTVPSYDGSDHNRIIPVPAAQGTISGYAFSTNGAQISLDLVRNAPGPVWDFQLGPVVGLNFNRNSNIQQAQVEALGKRSVAVEAGGYIGIGKTGVITSQYDKLSANVTYVHDVTGVHGSYVVTPQINYGTPLSRKAYVGLSAAANYVGAGYAQTYFSIDPAGSLRSGLPVYNARKGWKNYSFSAIGIYSLTGDLLHGLGLVGGVSYSRLTGNIADSPIVSQVGNRNQLFGALGLAYTF